MKSFYEDTKPFLSVSLPVTDGHQLYLERSGNPNGLPVLYLHGGPGGGMHSDFKRYFNPKDFHIIMFDQRGAGRSKPHASLTANTLPHLIADIEVIRKELSIDKWLVCGGSWGTTLAIAYAQEHPDRVSEMILRGLFLCRPSEIHWMYQDGASHVFPDLWENYIAPIPVENRENLVSSFYEQLTSSDKDTQMKAARAWSCWEFGMMKLKQDRTDFSMFSDDIILAMARIECHYFHHNIFLPEGTTLLDNMQKIQHIPTTLIHGRYDMVCPVKTAWDVHKALPLSKLHIIPDAGHSYSESGIIDRFVRTTDMYVISRGEQN